MITAESHLTLFNTHLTLFNTDSNETVLSTAKYTGNGHVLQVLEGGSTM